MADVFNRADVLLQAAAVQSSDPATQHLAGPWPDQTLRALASAAPELHDLRVADANGQWRLRLAGPAASDALEREEFQRARAEADARLIVTGPLRPRPDAPWVMVLSRAVRGTDGRFAGLGSGAAKIDR